MADAAKIQAALQKMDPTNDNHWTIQGDAKLETIKFLAGGEAVTRDELATIAPGFNRESLRAYLANNAGGTNAESAPPTTPAVGSGGDNAADDEPESAEVESGPSDREAEIEKLESEIADANEEINECQRVQAEMTKRIAALQSHTQILGAQLVKVQPPKTNMQTIQGYLESSKRRMAERGEARANVVASGVDLGALNRAVSPAPIDQALRNRPRNR